jgi:hypothetical protein
MAPRKKSRARDVANDSGKHRAERAVLNGTMERSVARPCTDAQDTIVRGEHVQPGDGVDVDQMRRTCEAESHDRHQALAARQDPAILRRQLRQQPHCLRQSPGPVVGELSWFHRSALPTVIGEPAPSWGASSGARSCERR